jgi:hypothetical protein
MTMVHSRRAHLRAEREARMAQQRVNVTRRLRIFNRAVWRKSSRFTVSGLVITAIGIVVISLGVVSLKTGIYPNQGFLLVGFGAIIAIIGIVRLLIGFINPAVPEDLPPLPEAEEDKPADIIEAASAAYEEENE